MFFLGLCSLVREIPCCPPHDTVQTPRRRAAAPSRWQCCQIANLTAVNSTTSRYNRAYTIRFVSLELAYSKMRLISKKKLKGLKSWPLVKFAVLQRRKGDGRCSNIACSAPLCGHYRVGSIVCGIRAPFMGRMGHGPYGPWAAEPVRLLFVNRRGCGPQVGEDLRLKEM